MGDIKIIDSIMGIGKTSYAIQMINDNPNKKYIYITPYLDEFKRVIEDCINFVEPSKYNQDGEVCTKMNNFHELLENGNNIVSTHELFKRSTHVTLELLKKQNYILIIDEVMDIVNSEEIATADLQMVIKEGYCSVDEDNRLIWNDEKVYDGRWARKLKTLCKNKSIYVVNGKSLVWTFPPEIFNCFDEVYVLTYLFDCQIMRFYFDICNLTWEKYKVINKPNYELIKHNNEPDDVSWIKELILFYETKAAKEIGQSNTALCSTWYKNKAKKEHFDKLKINLENFFKNFCNTKQEYNLWTTFKDFEERLTIKRAGDFLSHNIRATNKYRHKTSIAYLINKYMDESVRHFFLEKNITLVNTTAIKDQYALSEMIQFIFRSAIRDNNQIRLYVPSSRMRGILKRYLGIPKSV